MCPAVDLYLAPVFGSLRLEQLTPFAVQRWLTQQKTEHGARRRISLAHSVLRSALSEAKRLQLVSVNAAELVKVPQPPARSVVPLTIEQARAFLTVAGQHRLAALFTVALGCGLRLGEACGLRWSDVDLNTGELRIRQQLQKVDKDLVLQVLKTEKSRRTLMLPDVCIEALRAHHRRQLEARLSAGSDWIRGLRDTGRGHEVVFTTYRRLRLSRACTLARHPVLDRQHLRAERTTGMELRTHAGADPAHPASRTRTPTSSPSTGASAAATG